jgi:hypothetical protein
MRFWGSWRVRGLRGQNGCSRIRSTFARSKMQTYQSKVLKGQLCNCDDGTLELVHCVEKDKRHSLGKD